MPPLRPALLASLLVMACAPAAEESTTPASAGAAPAAAPGVPITLAPGETQRFGAAGDVAVTFVEVAEDSRCPVDATCITAGTLTARLRIAAADSTREVLARYWPAADTVAAGPYALTLREVQPVARAGVTIAPADYRATVVALPR